MIIFIVVLQLKTNGDNIEKWFKGKINYILSKKHYECGFHYSSQMMKHLSQIKYKSYHLCDLIMF